MNQFKKCKVIMLPTNNETTIFEVPSTKTLIYFPLKSINRIAGRHLYIISDDKIKQGDWIKFHVKPINKEWIHQVTKEDLIDYPNINNEGEKIIATTNTSLILQDDINKNKINYLPQPSQQFIEKYIEKYNKGEIINEVLVEYTYYVKSSGGDWDEAVKNSEKLKINPENNTITITTKEIKDNWNREEISLKLMYVLSEFAAEKGLTPTSKEMKEVNEWTNKWIEENL